MHKSDVDIAIRMVNRKYNAQFTYDDPDLSKVERPKDVPSQHWETFTDEQKEIISRLSKLVSFCDARAAEKAK